jgi:membrane protein DedA with SNARE-associated domain/rhodanese-related sulfurtransferase
MADLLVQYGVVLVFAWVFAVQAGMPIPAGPILLGAGALAGSGQMNLALAAGSAIAAALGADVLWYSLGRSQGTRLLETLCRFAMNPDSVVRDAKERLVAHGVRYLVLAKFLPGVNPLAAGLAGAVPIRFDRFLVYASTGALLWAGAWITLGYLFADIIGRVVTMAAPLGRLLVIVIAVSLTSYLVFKFVRRRCFLRHLWKARITPIELKRRLEAGDCIVIFDLRTALDVATAPFRIPGALEIGPEALRHPYRLIPQDSAVVFYCAEPREATSARMALRLASHGFKNVHPLSGGCEAWRQAGFVVEPIVHVPSRGSTQPRAADEEFGHAGPLQRSGDANTNRSARSLIGADFHPAGVYSINVDNARNVAGATQADDEFNPDVRDRRRHPDPGRPADD